MPKLDVTTCQFITGDALEELRKLESGKVNSPQLDARPAHYHLVLRARAGTIFLESENAATVPIEGVRL